MKSFVLFFLLLVQAFTIVAQLPVSPNACDEKNLRAGHGQFFMTGPGRKCPMIRE